MACDDDKGDAEADAPEEAGEDDRVALEHLEWIQDCEEPLP